MRRHPTRGGRRSAISAGLTAFLGLGSSACVPAELGDRHADQVEEYLATPFQPDGVPYLDPELAIGPPDGRTVALGLGSMVVLRFYRAIPDGEGPDLRVYEVGEDGAEARVAVSPDGNGWVELSRSASGPATDFDLSGTGIDLAHFVRIRGLDMSGPEPGFDLDAVSVLH